MIKLEQKKIQHNMTVGEIFLKRRKDFGLSYEEVSKATKISIEYLKYLENGDYSSLPAEVYIKNFIRTYASALGLDPILLIKKYKKEFDVYRKIKNSKQDRIISLKRSSKIKYHHFLIIPNIIKSVLIFVVLISFLGYLGYEVKKIMSPPSLYIESPENNLITQKSSVEVVASSDDEVHFVINGQEIFRDNDGKFRKVLNLQKGVNILTITATNKHGRAVTEYRKIMVQENTASLKAQ